MRAPCEDVAEETEADISRSCPSSSEPSESKSRNEIKSSLWREMAEGAGEGRTRESSEVERVRRRGWSPRAFGAFKFPILLLDWRPKPILAVCDGAGDEGTKGAFPTRWLELLADAMLERLVEDAVDCAYLMPRNALSSSEGRRTSIDGSS